MEICDFCFFELSGTPDISRTSGTFKVSGISFWLSEGSFAKKSQNQPLIIRKLLKINPDFLSFYVLTPGIK